MKKLISKVINKKMSSHGDDNEIVVSRKIGVKITLNKQKEDTP